ncbi:hypothetical protein C8Q73DRAFT_664797 [Cubamyces lactineus]|nr:hypothetical protein C8Q73DRAFT_664797 [Cubamyces lactineus]
MFGSEPRVLAVLFLLLVVQVYALPVPIQRAVVEIFAHGSARQNHPAMAEYQRLYMYSNPAPVHETAPKTAMVESFEEWFRGPWPDVPSEPIEKNLDSTPRGAVPPQQLHAGVPVEPSESDRRQRNPAYQARVAHFAHDRAAAGPAPHSRPLPAGPSARTLAFMALFLIFGVGVGWLYDSDSDDGSDQDREPEL